MATYITVSKIVEATLINEGDSGMHKYMQRLEWVLRGVRKLNLDTIKNVKTVLVPINDNNTVDLPLDCVSFTKVGIKRGDQLFELSNQRDNHSYPINNADNGDPIKDPQISTSIFANTISYNTYFANYRYPDGQNVGRLFGLGGGHNYVGYYSEWTERNQLVLYDMGVKSEEIYLEYISDGMEATGETIIDSRAEEFLLLWVESLQYYYKKDPMWQEAERKAYVELRLLQERMSPFSKKDLMNSLRKSFKLAIKY